MGLLVTVLDLDTFAFFLTGGFSSGSSDANSKTSDPIRNTACLYLSPLTLRHPQWPLPKIHAALLRLLEYHQAHRPTEFLQQGVQVTSDVPRLLEILACRPWKRSTSRPRQSVSCRLLTILPHFLRLFVDAATLRPALDIPP